MHGWAWAGLGLAVLTALWALGAYNRLIGLRGGIAAAAERVVAQARRRANETDELLALLDAPLAAEAAAIDTVRQTQAQVSDAAAALMARPGAADRAATLLRTEQALAAALARVVSLTQHTAELREVAAVGRQLEALQDVDAALALARQVFNDAAETYDQAIEAWPTRLLVPLFGLRPAGRL